MGVGAERPKTWGGSSQKLGRIDRVWGGRGADRPRADRLWGGLTGTHGCACQNGGGFHGRARVSPFIEAESSVLEFTVIDPYRTSK